MSLAQVGYVGIGWSVLLATTVTENIAIAVGIVTLLVLISTLLIRFSAAVEKKARDVISQMQADGDLPTRLERDEIQKALVTLIEYNEKNNR